jgi:lipopolysaccharide/colanic/teichoic acid biosynthesis glycosyltransferase
VGTPTRVKGPDAGERPRASLRSGARSMRVLDLAFAIVSVGLCFFVAPELYGAVLARVGAHMSRAASLHVLANCCANLLVMLAGWTASGRLDEKLGKSLSAVLSAHGLLALVVVLTHSIYSNVIMLTAAAVSAVLGIGAAVANHALKRPRIAAVGGAKAISAGLPANIERVESPDADLRPYDLILTGSAEELSPGWTKAVSRAMLAGKPVRHCAEYVEEAHGLVSIEHFDLDLLPQSGLASYQAAKRATDIAIAAALMPLALPVVAVASLAILVTMGRPIFFLQPRVGLGGNSFRMIKLRTMTAGTDRPDIEGRMAVTQGQRVTALGRWLRRTRVDELPQLWHVLIGEMSFIGPRPEWTLLAERYSASLPAYAYRHLVRPGITGWAQVRSGYAGDLEETKVKLAHDLFYLKHFSLALDIQILLRTLLTIATTKGAR